MCDLVGKTQYSEPSQLEFISVSSTKFLDYQRQLIFLFSSFLMVKTRTAVFNRWLLRYCIDTQAVRSCYPGQQ